VTAKVLRIGSTADSGGIQIPGPIAAPAGWNTLHLANGSGISESKFGALTVTNLAVEASGGIVLNNFNHVSHPAFQNTTSGGVQFFDLAALTITAVDTLDGTAGHTIGNFASGATTTLTASQSPLTFAVNTTSSGTLSATTIEGTEQSPTNPEE